MSNFDAVYSLTIKAEGCYSNNPSDKGGETWKGISRNKRPNWSGWKLIDEIKANCGKSHKTLITALECDEELEIMTRDFFAKEYWERLKLDLIQNIDLSAEIFDTAVNQGAANAVKYFQEALNLLNDNQQHYKDIETDGIIGPGTLSAFNSYMNTAKTIPGRLVNQNVKIMLKVMNGLQFECYRKIVVQNPAQETFFYGWIQRT